MNAAICLLLYGIILAWMSPPVLTRITRSGHSPRLSVTVWLTTIALAIGAWVVAAGGMVGALLGEHPAAPVQYCMDMLLALHHFGWAGDLTLGVASAAALACSLIVARRLVNALRRFWSRSREHANAAHILGVRTERPGVVLVTADKAAAYCVAGRPDAIVVTTGATAMLTEPELAAVLAHEQAHLAGRHPQLMMLLRALASAMPRLPLFRAAVEAVGRLVEMCADDNAARRHGPEALLCGLIALASPPAAGGVALGASDTAVVARAARLAAPAQWDARLREWLVLTAILSSVVVAPAIIIFVCHS